MVTTHNNLGIHLVRFEIDAKYVVDVVTHLKWITWICRTSVSVLTTPSYILIRTIPNFAILHDDLLRTFRYSFVCWKLVRLEHKWNVQPKSKIHSLLGLQFVTTKNSPSLLVFSTKLGLINIFFSCFSLSASLWSLFSSLKHSDMMSPFFLQ